MSFADELRNAPNEKAKQEAQQKMKDWNRLIKEWYIHVKSECKRAAMNGETEYYTKLSYFAENPPRTNWHRSDDEWWERISPRIIKQCSPKSEYTKAGLSEQDYQILSQEISKKLKSDGLNSEISECKWQKYILKSVYVERPKADQILGGLFNTFLNTDYSTDEGYYKLQLPLRNLL